MLCKGYAETGDYMKTGYNTIKMVEVNNASAYKIHEFGNYFGFRCYYLINEGTENMGWEL